MSVEPKWWNVREPTFGSPWWMSLVALVGCAVVGIWEILHGQQPTGWSIIGTGYIICGLVYLRFLLNNRAAVLFGGQSVSASFEFYQVGIFVAGIAIGAAAVASVLFPTSRIRFMFNLIRGWHTEVELMATVVMGSLYGVARGDARFRPFLAALLGLDGFGFFCLYLGEIRGVILFPMPLEAVFWILQFVLLCTLFTSMLSLQSRRELDTIAARKTAYARITSR